MIKKIISIISLLCVPIFLGSIVAFNVEDVMECPYDDCGDNTYSAADAVNAGKLVKDEGVNSQDGSVSVVVQIMDAFGINYTEQTDQTATFYIKEVINWLLVILGLVALISMIRGFYKMLLSKDSEEGYTSAKVIVRNAVIAIIIIGVSWFIVSWFFAILQITIDTTKPT